MARAPSLCFHQLYVLPGDLPLNFHDDGRPSVKNSVNFPCCRETFRQLLSTFLSVRRHYVNFYQLSKRPENLPLTSVNFLSILLLPSVNFPRCQKTFYQLSVWPGDFPLSSVNFPCRWETFRKFFVTQGDLLSNSVNFHYCQETFCQLPATFCVRIKHSFHLLQISLLLGKVLSTFRAARRLSVNLHHHFVRRGTFRQLFLRAEDHL